MVIGTGKVVLIIEVSSFQGVLIIEASGVLIIEVSSFQGVLIRDDQHVHSPTLTRQ